jgi:hypothetical protein
MLIKLMMKMVENMKYSSLCMFSGKALIKLKQPPLLILISDENKLIGVAKLANAKGYNFVYHKVFPFLIFTSSKQAANISLKIWTD